MKKPLEDKVRAFDATLKNSTGGVQRGSGFLGLRGFRQAEINHIRDQRVTK